MGDNNPANSGNTDMEVVMGDAMVIYNGQSRMDNSHTQAQGIAFDRPFLFRVFRIGHRQLRKVKSHLLVWLSIHTAPRRKYNTGPIEQMVPIAPHKHWEQVLNDSPRLWKGFPNRCRGYRKLL